MYQDKDATKEDIYTFSLGWGLLRQPGYCRNSVLVVNRCREFLSIALKSIRCQAGNLGTTPYIFQGVIIYLIQFAAA